MDLIKGWKGRMNMDKKENIQKLKRKNEITNLCKTWINNGIFISMDNFLEIQETLHLQSKILDRLDKMDMDDTSIIYQEQEINIISVFKEKLVNNLDNNKEYIFFVRGATKIGGLVLKGNIIIEKSEFVIKESEIFNNGCSIFFSLLNAESGICLWKGEYDNRIYVW